MSQTSMSIGMSRGKMVGVAYVLVILLVLAFVAWIVYYAKVIVTRRIVDTNQRLVVTKGKTVDKMWRSDRVLHVLFVDGLMVDVYTGSDGDEVTIHGGTTDGQRLEVVRAAIRSNLERVKRDRGEGVVQETWAMPPGYPGRVAGR